MQLPKLEQSQQAGINTSQQGARVTGSPRQWDCHTWDDAAAARARTFILIWGSPPAISTTTSLKSIQRNISHHWEHQHP